MKTLARVLASTQPDRSLGTEPTVEWASRRTNGFARRTTSLLFLFVKLRRTPYLARENHLQWAILAGRTRVSMQSRRLARYCAQASRRSNARARTGGVGGARRPTAKAATLLHSALQCEKEYVMGIATFRDSNISFPCVAKTADLPAELVERAFFPC